MSICKIVVLSWRVILILLTLTLICLPFMSPELAGGFFYIAFLALPLLVLNVLTAILSHKAWRWVFVGLLVICLPIYARYVPSWQHPAGGDTTDELLLVSCNVDNFLLRIDSMHKSAALIREQHPDIICLQERPHEAKMSWDSIRAQFPGYRYSVTNSREDDVLNVAVLSRWPLSDLREHYFEGTLNKYITVDVHKDGRVLRIFNVHLQTTGIEVKGHDVKAREVVPPMYRDDLGDAEGSTYEEAKERFSDIWSACVKNSRRRNAQALDVASEIEKSPYPVVLCGDFNDTPSSYAVRTIGRQMHDLSCRWPLVGTFQRLYNLMKIDYVFCSDELEGLSYRLIANPWSDHKMQVARLKWEG